MQERHGLTNAVCILRLCVACASRVHCQSGALCVCQVFRKFLAARTRRLVLYLIVVLLLLLLALTFIPLLLPFYSCLFPAATAICFLLLLLVRLQLGVFAAVSGPRGFSFTPVDSLLECGRASAASGMRFDQIPLTRSYCKCFFQARLRTF